MSCVNKGLSLEKINKDKILNVRVIKQHANKWVAQLGHGMS